VYLSFGVLKPIYDNIDNINNYNTMSQEQFQCKYDGIGMVIEKRRSINIADTVRSARQLSNCKRRMMNLGCHICVITTTSVLRLVLSLLTIISSSSSSSVEGFQYPSSPLPKQTHHQYLHNRKCNYQDVQWRWLLSKSISPPTLLFVANDDENDKIDDSDSASTTTRSDTSSSDDSTISLDDILNKSPLPEPGDGETLTFGPTGGDWSSGTAFNPLNYARSGGSGSGSPSSSSSLYDTRISLRRMKMVELTDELFEIVDSGPKMNEKERTDMTRVVLDRYRDFLLEPLEDNEAVLVSVCVYDK
jgi:hypothetical protein